MTLFAPSEDLAIRTLRCIPGTLARLLYLATLRDDDGIYRHWGMARMFGDEASVRAVESAHGEAVNEVLRKPVAELWRELAGTEEREGTSARDQLREIMRVGRNVVPPGSSEAADWHLSSVLRVLFEMAAAREELSNRPAA